MNYICINNIIDCKGDSIMKKGYRLLFLLAFSLTLLLSGCRRTPIETETEVQTETETETETEKQTEKKKETEKETEKQTEKQTTKQTEKTTVSPNTSNSAVTPQTNQNTDTNATSMCPYCYNYFSTQTGADGSSVYSSHVAQEEAYLISIGGTPITGSSGTGSSGSGDNNSSDSDTSYSDTNNGGYAQCEYCFQWFSTDPGVSGYSPYSEHVAAEAAYSAQSYEQDYYQCPNCGNWVTYTEYQYHISGGY